jgi:hypothetical protein
MSIKSRHFRFDDHQYLFEIFEIISKNGTLRFFYNIISSFKILHILNGFDPV